MEKKGGCTALLFKTTCFKTTDQTNGFVSITIPPLTNSSHRGWSRKTIEIRLEPEPTSSRWIQYLRGPVYLKLKRGDWAAVEIRKILNHLFLAYWTPL
jgi:hypothetical protein